MTAEIEKLRAELEQARAERDFWKGEFECSTDDGLRSTLQTAFGLSRQESRLLEVLRRRPGVALKEPLFSAAWAESEKLGKDPTLKILDIYVCKLRAKIGTAMIITHWGRGYELAPAMRVRINEALAERQAVAA